MFQKKKKLFWDFQLTKTKTSKFNPTFSYYCKMYLICIMMLKCSYRIIKINCFLSNVNHTFYFIK